MSFEVHALRYGYRTGRRGQLLLGYDERAGEEQQTAYYVWLLRSPARTVLVDAGMRAGRAGMLAAYRAPAAVLAGFGVPPEEVDTLVLTHLHYDHAGTVADFPNADYVVQQSEVDYWTGPHAKRIAREHWLFDEDALAHVQGPRLRAVHGDEELAPGLSVHLVGGHTAGMQVVRIETPAGPVVLASDAAHLFENFEDDRPAPLLHSMPGVYSAFDRLAELAGDTRIVVPGHDPAVLQRFPLVADGVARIG